MHHVPVAGQHPELAAELGDRVGHGLGCGLRIGGIAFRRPGISIGLRPRGISGVSVGLAISGGRGLGRGGIVWVSISLRISGGGLVRGVPGQGGIVAGRDVGGIRGAGAVISRGLGGGVIGHDR